MTAWAVDRPGPVDGAPLVRLERPVPEPGPGQVRIRVLACGVCRTDLHLAEGDLAPHRHLVTPGHEVVGTVDALGPDCTRWQEGQRIGVPWLARTCRHCRFCLSGRENLCLNPCFTGWDVDGGYAEFALVNEDYAYLLPDRFDDVTAAPLLCAGIIGYRALQRADLPEGGRLGIYGFGGSAHLTAQVAMVSDIPPLRYADHLFEERTLRSVTANTRRDGEDFLAEAARIGLRVAATPYPMTRADVALTDLAHDRVNGAAVLLPD
jgi:propanol-preferring alcohol dehydrogenase